MVILYYVNTILFMDQLKYQSVLYLHSVIFICRPAQLLGAPTPLDASHRYCPSSDLDTLLNFCTKAKRRKQEM